MSGEGRSKHHHLQEIKLVIGMKMREVDLDMKMGNYLTNSVEKPRDCPTMVQFAHLLPVNRLDHSLGEFFAIVGFSSMEGLSPKTSLGLAEVPSPRTR